MKQNVKVQIDLPFDGKWGTHVYIRDILVDLAIRRGVGLEITIPRGTAIVDPQKWKDRNDIRNDIFKVPTKPMRLYGGFVPVPEMVKEEKGVKKEEVDVFQDEQTKLL